MHIIDSHFHWWPRSIFDKLCKRTEFPKARVNKRGGYDYMRRQRRAASISTPGPSGSISTSSSNTWTASATASTWSARSGRSRSSFSDMPVEEGRDYAIMWNEEMAGAQKKYPGRLWASAAVPLQDTRVAIEVLDDAVNRLGLMGVNLPGSVGADARIDAERLRAVLRPLREARPAGVPASDRRDLPGHARRLRRRAAPEPRPRHRGQRRGDAADPVRHDGAASQAQDRDVAHRRLAALPGRPHGQELQGREAAAAGAGLHEAHVHRHGVAALGRHASSRSTITASTT